MIAFPAFEPDRAPYNLNSSDQTINVLPAADGYKPMPTLREVSEALDDECIGAFSVSNNGGFAFIAGTRTKLFSLDTSVTPNVWNDVSREQGYAVPNGDRWSFSVFGNQIIACQLGNPPQTVNISSADSFADIDDAPTARTVWVSGDFLVFGHLSDHSNAIQWSGLNDMNHWVAGRQGSDIQTFPDGGEVMNGFGGQTGGVVMQRDKIRYMNFSPESSYTFTFSEANAERGVLAPNSVAKIGPGHFLYLCKDGFFAGVEGNPIGATRVDEWFFNEVDHNYLSNVHAIVDPFEKIVWWIFRTASEAFKMIGITGDAPVSNINDALQTIMAHLADMNAGTSPLDDTFTLSSILSSQGNVRFDASLVGNSTTQVLTVPNASGVILTDTTLLDEDGKIAADVTGNAATADDAGLLNGQDGSFYQNAGNINAGTISTERLPATISSDTLGSASNLNGQDGTFYQNASNLNAGEIPTERLPNTINIQTQNALDEKLPLYGGTMTGDIDLNGHKITGIDVLPVGFEAPWQNETPPSGWFIQDGSTFDAATYPLLAAHLGGNTLPDMRGIVPRGLDSGRGLDPDAGRVLGSYQADEFGSHAHTGSTNTTGNHSHSYSRGSSNGSNITVGHSSNLSSAQTGSAGNHSHKLVIDSTGGTETRMKNIAKIWLIKHD